MCGAQKYSNSCAPYVDEIIATPTKFMGRVMKGMPFPLPSLLTGTESADGPAPTPPQEKHLEAPLTAMGIMSP